MIELFGGRTPDPITLLDKVGEMMWKLTAQTYCDVITQTHDISKITKKKNVI